MRIMICCKNTILNLAKTWSIVMLFFVPILGLLIVYPSWIPHLNHIISQRRLSCTLFRWVILITSYGALILIFRHWAKTRPWSAAEKAYRRKQCFQILLWAVLFEVVVCDHIFSVIMHYGKGLISGSVT